MRRCVGTYLPVSSSHESVGISVCTEDVTKERKGKFHQWIYNVDDITLAREHRSRDGKSLGCCRSV